MMEQERNNRPEKRKKYKGIKLTALLAALLLLLTAAITGTVAFLTTQTNEVTNEFVPGEVTCAVSNGVVTNTGTVNAYLRAAVVVNWVDGEGNIYGEPPAYTVSVGSGWFLCDSDGYYYHTNPVAADASAAALTASTNDPAPVGCTLQVQVLAEAMQADGVDGSGNHPVELAWKVTVNESTGSITKN